MSDERYTLLVEKFVFPLGDWVSTELIYGYRVIMDSARGGGGWVNGHLGIVFPWMVGRSTLLLWGSGVSMDGREINGIAMGEWCFHGW